MKGWLSKFFLLFILTIFISGCGIRTIKPEMSIPNQSLLEEAPKEMTKVIFFNDSNMLAYGLDGSSKINLKLNGKAVGSINRGRYAQLFLLSGAYDLYMAHFDLSTYKSNYKLNIGKDDAYIRIYSRPTSNAFDIVNELPIDFKEKYKPFNQ